MLYKIKENGDINYIHHLTRELSMLGNDNGKYGFRIAGSTGEWKTARRIESEMKRIGLQDVAVEEFPVHSWEFTDGSLTIAGRTMEMSSFCGTPGTGPDGITGDIADVGRGTAADYGDMDVRGKIVLCTVDLDQDYWLNLPVYEAALRGAAAVIVVYSGEYYGTHCEALNSCDSQCECSIPVGNISRNDGEALRELLKNGPVEGTVKLIIKMDFNGCSSNVVGYIPGRCPDKVLLLGGHMDGYFHSYQDDLLGVGIILGIAKAMIECGYKPEHTIAFIAHGSEEYGVSGSVYDWCIGSWYSINKLHPDWSERVEAFFNIDAIRPGTPVYNIAAAAEYHGFFHEYMRNMEVPSDSWPGGKALQGLNGPWDDGYNYAIKGVPGIICGRGPADWSYRNYHTQFDNYKIFEDEKEIVQFVMEQYMEMVYCFDQTVLPPFSFHYAFVDFFEDCEDFANETLDILKNKVAEICETARLVYEKIAEVNGNASGHRRAGELRKELLGVYKMIQGDLLKLTLNDEIVPAHQPVINNIKSLKNAAAHAASGNLENVIESLWSSDHFDIAYQFSPQTYRWICGCRRSGRDDLFWGTGKVHKVMPLENVIKYIKMDNCKLVEKEINSLLTFETILLEEILENEAILLKKIQAAISRIDILSGAEMNHK